jgi:hypothetical protein
MRKMRTRSLPYDEDARRTLDDEALDDMAR